MPDALDALDALIHEFVGSVCDAVSDAVDVAPEAVAIARHVRGVRAMRNPIDAHRLPGCDFLDDALNRALHADDPGIVGISALIERLAPHLHWILREGLPGAAADFPFRHANAIVVGDNGLNGLNGLNWLNGLARAEVTVGLTVMAPQAVYADHHHPPEETYLVLSEGEWRQNAEAWHSPGVGGTVYNPPGIVHSMRSLGSPLLAVWMLRPSTGAGHTAPS